MIGDGDEDVVIDDEHEDVVIGDFVICNKDDIGFVMAGDDDDDKNVFGDKNKVVMIGDDVDVMTSDDDDGAVIGEDVLIGGDDDEVIGDEDEDVAIRDDEDVDIDNDDEGIIFSEDVDDFFIISVSDDDTGDVDDVRVNVVAIKYVDDRAACVEACFRLVRIGEEEIVWKFSPEALTEINEASAPVDCEWKLWLTLKTKTLAKTTTTENIKIIQTLTICCDSELSKCLPDDEKCMLLGRNLFAF